MTTRRRFLIASAAVPAALAAASLPAAAAEPPVFQGADGVAINGYDPVAYFTDKSPVEGLAEHALDWRGATWRFASAENLSMFEADPERFAPAYGGYCAYAVSGGYTASTSPRAWTVHEGRLFLNYNRAVRALWGRDIPFHVARADGNWPGVLDA